jgi:hypothetical protein
MGEGSHTQAHACKHARARTCFASASSTRAANVAARSSCMQDDVNERMDMSRTNADLAQFGYDMRFIVPRNAAQHATRNTCRAEPSHTDIGRMTALIASLSARMRTNGGTVGSSSAEARRRFPEWRCLHRACPRARPAAGRARCRPDARQRPLHVARPRAVSCRRIRWPIELAPLCIGKPQGSASVAKR